MLKHVAPAFEANRLFAPVPPAAPPNTNLGPNPALTRTRTLTLALTALTLPLTLTLTLTRCHLLPLKR